jgi:pseudouridylate synthase
MTDPSDVIVAPSVAEALRARRPVVALETTLVTHGFPHPEGLEIAAALEGQLRPEAHNSPQSGSSMDEFM